MAQAIDRPPLHEVEIAFAGVIPQKRAFAPDEDDFRACRDFHQCVEWMGGNGHIETPRWGEKRAKTQEGRTLGVRPSRKLEAVYVFSLVVGHGATHHRRMNDDGRRRGIWPDSKSWVPPYSRMAGGVKRVR